MKHNNKYIWNILKSNWFCWFFYKYWNKWLLFIFFHEWMYHEWMHHEWTYHFMKSIIEKKDTTFRMTTNKSINTILFYLFPIIICLLPKRFSLNYLQSSRSVDPQKFVRWSSRRGATLRRKVIYYILGDNYSQNSSTRMSEFVLRTQREFVELISIYIYVLLFYCIDNFHKNLKKNLLTPVLEF